MKRKIWVRSPLAWLIILSVITIMVLVAVAGRWRDAQTAAAILRTDPDSVLADPRLAAQAVKEGQGIFAAHCASCHGDDGRGAGRVGMPDLTDRDVLLASDAAAIEQIVLHGIRTGLSKSQGASYMPAYATPRPYGAEPIPPLAPADVRDVTAYLLSTHDRSIDPAAAGRGAAIFGGRGACWDCHGRDGSGDYAIGAPNLIDRIWLYGGSREAIARSIMHGRRGLSPAFARILDARAVRMVAIYTAALANGGPK